MKILNLKENVIALNTPTIAMMIQSSEFNRGKSYALPKRIKLNRLHDLNKRRSVTSSNEIEGIKIKKSREDDIFLKDLSPESEEEYLLCGYNKALENVFSVYQYQSLSESYIKDLHYMLYEGFAPNFGGKYRDSQNYIREFDREGKLKRTVFIPPDPREVPALMGNLIYQYNECASDPRCNRLLLIFAFILDFLCIHPFADGNGRISRLLTSFLLLQNGYDLDRYYALSYLILDNLDGYYASLEKSSKDWETNENDYEPFVLFLLSLMNEGYTRLSYILEVNSSGLRSSEKVKKVIDDAKEPLNKGDIEETLFSLSRTTIEKALSTLVKTGKIQMIQSGRYAKYYKLQ